ncbi:MAG TPA: TonB-dependent receptor [Myxococcales bacterium]|nr:TonB-dependent receptor [Myxococcales bacterium]
MRLAAVLCLVSLARAALAQPVPDPQREAPPAAPEVFTPPKLIAEGAPAYPEGAKGGARVVLQVDIDERGNPGNLVVLGDPQPGFDEAALAAAAQLRFEPARRGERPVAVRIQYAFNFVPPAAPGPPRPEDLPVNLSGQIRERGTRRKLSGIEVTAGDRSAVTDAEGRFEIRGLPEGEPIEIAIAVPGYERFSTRETVPPGQKLEVEYRLQALFVSPFEATVEGERERTEISRTTVSREETERVAGTGGDPLKVVEDLPGVARTSPIGGGFLVIRGSKPGDSLVYLDSEPIPLLFHFAAISSTVNPDLLEGIDYIPGNFSARYGDLTGGLVEVRTRKLRDEFHGYANINLLEASALVEGAVPGVPGLSLAIAGRRSYIDYIIRAAVSGNEDFSLTVAPRYYDAQLRLDWRPPDSRHSFSFLALTSDDKLGLVLNRPAESDPNLSGSIDAETGFQQLRFKHEWRDGPASVSTIAMYERLVLSFDVGINNLHLMGHNLFLRSSAAWDASDRVAFGAGLDLAYRRAQVDAVFRQSFLFREGEFNQQGPRPDDEVFHSPRATYFRFSPGLWSEARIRLLPGLSLTPGLRADLYHYGASEPHTNWTLSPRLTARWELSETVALKAGIGLYSEGARNGDAAYPFGNPGVVPERAWQATLGTELRPLPGLFLSVEGFYKGLYDLIVRTDAVQTVNGVTRAQILDNAGNGRVFGLELLFRKELTERFFGWIAYTLSRSDRFDRPGQPQRLFDFDQTHNLTIIASYKLGRGWQIGGRLRIISGNPDTPVLGARYLANFDAYLPIYGPTNSLRVPIFHQLDVRVDKVWTYDSWMLDVYLDVLNLYNHRSIEGSAYSYDFSQHAYFEGLPVVPTLGLKASF